jgi:hypothetical protein
MVLNVLIRHKAAVWFIAGIAAITFLAPLRAAHAYIDPGTGGMLLQLLLGGVAGALVIIKLYWYRLREIINQMLGRSTPDEPDAD